VSITGGDTWTPDPNNDLAYGPPYSTNLQYFVNSSVGGYNTITVSAGSGTGAVLVAYELSNMQTTPRDTSVLGVDAVTTTPSAGSITTTAPREILFASLSSSASVSTAAFACGTIDAISSASTEVIAHFTESTTGTYSDCWILTGTGAHLQTFLSAYKGN
jgi:hypothetical protein